MPPHPGGLAYVPASFDSALSRNSEASSSVVSTLVQGAIMKFVLLLVAFGFLAYADASCVAARGHVICPDKNQKHDGKLVVIKLVEGERNELDEGYASKNGYFSVYGCTSGVGRGFEPQLHIISKCKGDLNSRIRYTLPRVTGHQAEYNISDLINLKGYHQREDTNAGPVHEPCSN